ncbi:olfactory receptor 8H1-like [Ornithorhynchus anatinus]|uniref:olfactory receptor 8H1-like n=1 Tax=Ornithorhynchus anatinus TaxID=9258 RepID=UPI0019D419EA|nr:olfactory receptor 8H1-like [Ornithorhynchus anatinus]
MLKPLAAGNDTGMANFILMGLTDSPRAQLVLFVVFLSIYMISVVGNLGLILIIQKDTQLHSPMYFFLCGLSFVDLSYSTAITPKTLVNLVTSRKKISFIGCFAQMYFFISLAGTECFLLSAMAYDRYVAICNPLLYSSVMSSRLCMWLMVGSYGVAFTNSLISLLFIARLPFCNSNVIHHFFCDTSPILVLSCTDTHNTEIMIFILAGSTLAMSLITIAVSYMAIVSAVLKIDSTVGRKKAFSTCASHLTGVTIFYGTLIFTYLKPRKSYSLGKDQVASVFYTIVVPMLNPLIYSLRNKEVKNAISRMIHLIQPEVGQQAEVTRWRRKGKSFGRRPGRRALVQDFKPRLSVWPPPSLWSSPLAFPPSVPFGAPAGVVRVPPPLPPPVATPGLSRVAQTGLKPP